MKKRGKIKLFSMILALLMLSITSSLLFSINQVNGRITREVKTFGLLVDQFAPSTRVENDYECNANELKNSLIDVGWSSDSFSYLYGDDAITITNLKEEMDILEETVDSNDVVIIFFATHGYLCLRDILDFNSWFHKEFLEIPTDYKILLIDSCHAGEFIEPLLPYSTNNSFYAMGSVAAIEYGIGFTPDDSDEGWPYSEREFYGIISSHFWATTLTNSSADTNADDIISMTEMYDYSLPIIKKIYAEVFIEDPDLAEFIETETGYTDNYPNPVVIENLASGFSLYMDYLNANIETLMITGAGKLVAIFVPIGTALVIVFVILPIAIKQKNEGLKED